MKIIIETRRLLLREIEKSDLEELYELDSDPEVHKFLGNKPVQRRDETIKIIESVRQQYRENGIGRWAIIEKCSGNFIGWAGLKYEKKFQTELNYYDLGYRLKRKYWGNGIATETALESLKYGFETLKLKEICAAAHFQNIASNKILKKVGLKFVETFEYEGEVHNWYKIKRNDWK